MKNYIENHAVVLIGNIASSVNVKVKGSVGKVTKVITEQL